jgi:non-canonical purine NTP pyrophosphatase (RdgB/HAM1 family)
LPDPGRGELLIATGSSHKLAELTEMLQLPHTYLLSLSDADLEDSAEENGSTFEENAIAKAMHYARLSGMPTLADDSGLEVDALDGRPGIYTRRYAGPNATDEENNTKLLAELAALGVAPSDRTARYQCVLVLAEPDSTGEPQVLETATGTFEGRVATESRGDGGFGYDPIFEPSFEAIGGRTVGQLTRQEKNEVSHRALAARAMREKLLARGY